VYELTAEGRTQADPRWLKDLSTREGDGQRQRQRALREGLRQLHEAARQVAVVGSPNQVEQATEIIRGARQALYLLLANE